MKISRPTRPHACSNENKSNRRFISFASFFQNPPRLPLNPPEGARSGREGRLGRVFLYSAQKKLGDRLWGKAWPASPIPHLGLCKLNHPHELGSGPEQEVLLKNFQTSDSSPSKALHNTTETGTIEVSKTSAAEPQTRPQAARLEPLVYRVEEIAQLLAISSRAAYNLCNTTKDFRVLRIGTSIRVNKQSFDAWFAAL